jgi:hypothetical protein
MTVNTFMNITTGMVTNTSMNIFTSIHAYSRLGYARVGWLG